MKQDALDLVVVIMAGGIGTRFWPLSTEEKPKQFLDLFGKRTLLQKSFDRISNLVPPDRILVLTNAAFTSIVEEQLPEVPLDNVIGEPLRRDTAAAVGLATALVRKRFGNSVMVTLTADHLIEPVDLFQKTILSAARRAAVDSSLYTLGIAPTYPATGYGYLERGARITDDEGIEHFQLVQFKEKPDTETACRCIESGRFYWNSGIFIWTADAIWKEIELHLPNHAKVLAKAAEHERTPQWNQVLKTAFESIEPVSIDIGVMEKASDVCCVASSFSWNDVGGWLALEGHLAGDNAGNRCRGETVALDAADNLVFCENPRETVVLIGIKDLIVVRSGSTTLISHKNRVEELKELVKNMGKE